MALLGHLYLPTGEVPKGNKLGQGLLQMMAR